MTLRKRSGLPWIMVAVAALAAGCAASGHTASTGSTSPSTSSITTSTTSATSSSTTTAPVTTTLPPGWTEPELLAQLIMVSAEYAAPAASTQAVREGAGGLVFFGEPAAAAAAGVRSGLAALESAARVPPLMATDEEGGQIARLANIVGPLPWPRQMATQWTPADVTAHVHVVASAMAFLGMNMDLAPVLDTASATDTIDEENLRSFSEVGSTAAAYGLAFWRGLSDGGIIGVVKHFPGLGHANGDTDVGPATDPPLADLVGNDLVPFRQAIAAGVGVVMMSNVIEPDWGTVPASVNPAAYEYLRHLGFGGLILTDSLDAGAISAAGLGGAAAVVKAIESGADMAMVTSAADFPAALTGLESAVSSGALPMAQVIASVNRIIAVKNAVLPAAHRIAPLR